MASSAAFYLMMSTKQWSAFVSRCSSGLVIPASEMFSDPVVAVTAMTVRNARTLKASFSDGSGSKLPAQKATRVQEEIMNEWICLEAVPSGNITKYINDGDIAVLGSRLLLNKSLILSDQDSKNGLGLYKQSGIFQSVDLYRCRLDVQQIVESPPPGFVQLYVVQSDDATYDLKLNKLFKDKSEQDFPSRPTEVVAFSELRFAALARHIGDVDLFAQGSATFKVAMLKMSIVDLLNQEEFYATSVNGLLPHWRLVFRDVAGRDKFLGGLTGGQAKLEFMKQQSLSFRELLSSKRKEMESALEDSYQHTKSIREVLDKVKSLEEIVPAAPGKEQ
ncbi:unnamed protein product [Symbiodinium sp. CCMP2592]|nr:unnamed protein product [Symbiodinium sp. CCMP2592]